MNRRNVMGCLLLSLFGATATAMADSQSPARAQLQGFLAAFNSGERETIISFGKDHAPPDFLRTQIVDQTLEMYRMSGGYDLLEVNETDPLSLTSWVRARKTQEIVLLAVQVHADEPERISAIGFLSDEPPERLRSRK
jgi:hypothetical protein